MYSFSVWLRLVMYSLPVLCLLGWLEYSLYRLPNTYRTKHEQVMKDAEKWEWLCLGNSHMLKGFNPDVAAAPAYNLANVSQTWPIDLELLKIYAPKMPKLKWVIVSASYFTPWVNLAEADRKRLHFYKRFHGVPSEVGQEFTFGNWTYTGMYGPRLGMRLALFPEQNEVAGFTATGFQEQTPATPEDIDYMAATSRVSEHHAAMHKRHWSANVQALDSLASYCKANKLELLLVHFPTHMQYKSLLRQEYLAPAEEMLHHFTVTRGIRYLDLEAEQSHWPDAMFSDADHLSVHGAKHCTQMVSQVIKRVEASKAN